jgi:hypothetical protein
MYQLYYYPGNANLAPHILLEEIGADYELQPRRPRSRRMPRAVSAACST